MTNTIVQRSSLFLSTVDNYHPPLQIDFCFNSNVLPIIEDGNLVYDFKNGDIDELNCRLSSIDFESLLSVNSIEDNVAKLYATLRHNFNYRVPVKRRRLPCSSPPWFNADLRRLRNKKNKLWKLHLQKKDTLSYNLFVESYNEFSNFASDLYNEYLNKTKNELYNNSRAFFKFVNSKRRTDDYPCYMTYGGVSGGVPSTICDMFASFFEKSFSSPDFQPDINQFHHLNLNPLSFSFVHKYYPRDCL